MNRRAVGLASALMFTACGTSASPHYGEWLDVAATDAEASVDVAPAIDTAPQPVVDVVTPRDVPRHSGPPYPLILHHGFAGFREVQAVSLTYFYNVARDLRERGEVVYESEVPPFQPPQDRAYALRTYVDTVLAETGASRVVMIAHSEGGLDARALISTLGYGDRIALLTTVSTPHRGTRVADQLINGVPSLFDGFIDSVGTLIGWTLNDVRARSELRRTLAGMSEAASEEFNRQNRDDPRVVYWSWAGRTTRGGDQQCAGARYANRPEVLDQPNAFLAPFVTLLEQNDPVAHVNDGLVEVQSARWGLFMGCIPADHMDEVGQIAHDGPLPHGFDHIAWYRDLAAQIRAAGY